MTKYIIHIQCCACHHIHSDFTEEKFRPQERLIWQCEKCPAQNHKVIDVYPMNQTHSNDHVTALENGIVHMMKIKFAKSNPCEGQ